MFNTFVGKHPNKKNHILRMMKAHGADGCAIPYNHLKDFEIDTKCPRNGRQPNSANGCVYNYTLRRDGNGIINDWHFDNAIGGVVDDVAEPWYKSIDTRIRPLPKSDIGPSKAQRAREKAKAQHSANMRRIGKLLGKKDKGFDIPSDWQRRMNTLSNTVLNEQYSLNYVPIMPRIEKYPKLAGVISAYQSYYARKKAEFDNAALRIGYGRGRVFPMQNPKGVIDTMPLIQQKFHNGYYTLFYKYTSNTYANAVTDETASASEFFFKTMNDKYYPMHPNIPGDPKQSFRDVQELIFSPDKGYRSQFLLDVMRVNYVRFSIILQIFNSKHKEEGAMKPKFSLEMYKFGRDHDDEQGVGNFFSKFRIHNSQYTSNKHLVHNQHQINIFAINCGNDAPNAWTIAMSGGGRSNELNCNASIYMTIPTPSLKSKKNKNYLNTLKTSCTWAWMQKYEGRILYSNGEPINMSRNMGNVEDFENNHVGDIMLLWTKCEYHDPYQVLQVVPWNVFVDPHSLQTIMFRPKNADDQVWAESILKIMTGGEDVRTTDEFKALVEKLKGKQELDFQEYVNMCDTYMLNTQTSKFATDVGCIF